MGKVLEDAPASEKADSIQVKLMEFEPLLVASA